MNDKKYTIKNISIKREGDKFFIDAQYKVTEINGDIYLEEIHRLPININNRPQKTIEHTCYRLSSYDTAYIDLGFGNLRCNLDTNITRKLVRSNTKKMTIEEIEKVLGHRVEIVSTKGEK